MPRVHTHYDNLKVTRNAPPEVIRAAYKSLSQKFHPDRNPDDPKATQTFQIINSAYEILSDPLKRREHDDWIAASEAAEPHFAQAHRHYSADPNRHSGYQRGPYAPASGPQASTYRSAGQHPLKRFRPGVTLRHASGYLFLTAVASLVLLGIMLG